MFQCNIPARTAYEDEIGDLYDYAGEAFDVPRGDAQGIVECFNVAVFDDGRSILPAYAGKVMVALAPGRPNEVYIFTWQDDRLRLARRYVEA